MFGTIYSAVKGVWTHALASLILAVCTMGLSWIIYPFFAKDIMKTHYLKKGWVEFRYNLTDDSHTDQKKEEKICPMCAEKIKLAAVKCRFCGEKFDAEEVKRQIEKQSTNIRIACSDGCCVGIINEMGFCGRCG